MKSKVPLSVFFAVIIIIGIFISMLERWKNGAHSLDDIHRGSNFLWILTYGLLNVVVIRLMVGDFAKSWLLLFSFVIGCLVTLGFEYWIFWRTVVFKIEIMGACAIMFLSPLLLYVFLFDKKTPISGEKSDSTSTKEPTYSHGARIE